MNDTQNSEPQFLNFGDFEIGDMVSECRCDGIMTRQTVRLFPAVPVVTDVGICDRCGAIWDGRMDW